MASKFIEHERNIKWDIFNDCVLNVRIRMPIVGNHHPRNFITKIVNYKKFHMKIALENQEQIISILLFFLSQTRKTVDVFHF